jgi:beta-glucosidase
MAPEDPQSVTFPKDFLWGAATASYQIEGGAREDGRGESIWDRFSHTPGLVKNGDTGDTACDHYHRYREDVGIIKDLGVQGYRFSVAWPRLFPAGKGPLNPKGLDFYSRLVDELLAKGIRPFLTLYHWDLPQALEDKGGWSWRDTASYFADYSAAVARGLGDRVHDFMTFNEPCCTIDLGYAWAVHAPGKKETRKFLFQATHNLLLAHGWAVKALRQNASKPLRAGIVLNAEVPTPATDSPADREACGRQWTKVNGRFSDPVFLGNYPQAVMDDWGPDAPVREPGDMEAIAAPTDFLGLNVYMRSIIQDDPGSPPWRVKWIPAPKDAPRTDMGWEIHPPVTRLILEEHHRRYGNLPGRPPLDLYITENGAAFPGEDQVGPDGRVHDQARIDYLRAHFREAHKVLKMGARFKGYFVWSLMDNFEWAEGYGKRFGIVHVDYKTQKRTPKDSYRWYQEVIRTGKA